ncbi:hypothetical protein NIES25_04800 [Nostoc linckia NIES-25]|nr:hypothetical protein NIES25_04800 [Nostoc linckia NIES-25]
MGMIFLIILTVWAIVNFVGLCSVVISFTRCRTVRGYRNIAIIGSLFIPAILLFLTLLDLLNNKPSLTAVVVPSVIADIQVMAVIVWSKTYLICFLGACVTAAITLFKANAIRRYSGLAWGFLISSLSACAFVFIKF